MTSHLKTPAQPPPVFTTTPASILTDARQLIEESCRVQARILADVDTDSANFSNVLLPLANSQNYTASKSHTLVFYRFASADPKLRKASKEAQTLLDEHSNETAMNEDLFKLVQAVVDRKEQLELESALLLRRFHKTHIKNGLALPAGPARDRFKAIQNRISQLTTQFRENLAETGAVWFSQDELEGVPDTVLSRFEKGKGEYLGKYQVTHRIPDYMAVIRHANQEQTRQTLFLAQNNDCKENISVFEEVVILRDEAARLLGYPNHASFRIEDKMAKTPETVNAFLKDLQLRLTERSYQEVGRLKELKKHDLDGRGQAFDGRFYVWDLSYYHRLMLEHQHSVDHQKIEEYFPVQTAIISMMEIVQNLFGLNIVEEDANKTNTWHSDVQLFSVWNAEDLGDDFLGYLYLDLFSRDGKISNAANFNLVPGFVKEDGTRQCPATALVCNFPKASPENPSLLRHDQVVTLFHELGHAIHDLVSKVTHACFHGTETVVDFGEAPSQMLEYWCWVPSQLKAMGKHYSSLSPQHMDIWRKRHGADQEPPPTKIPDDLVDCLIKSKHVNAATSQLMQISIGMFDMAVHEPDGPAQLKDINMSVLFNKIRSGILPLDCPQTKGLGDEWGHPQTKLTHLMGEYDAGYYSYLFSKAYASDMFSTIFKDNPADRERGLRYRYGLLEKGGSQDEMKTLTDFLGRKPNVIPFHQELGIE